MGSYKWGINHLTIMLELKKQNTRTGGVVNV
jgi:hypothetical protein